MVKNLRNPRQRQRVLAGADEPCETADSSIPNGLAIGAVARQVDIATSVIRYYEEIELLPAPTRLNGRRRYDASTVQRLRVIGHAQQAGFTLGEIRELFFGFESGTPPSVRWEALASRKLAELEAQLTRIHAMQSLLREGMRCGCLTIEQCTVWLSGMASTINAVATEAEQ